MEWEKSDFFHTLKSSDSQKNCNLIHLLLISNLTNKYNPQEHWDIQRTVTTVQILPINTILKNQLIIIKKVLKVQILPINTILKNNAPTNV